MGEKYHGGKSETERRGDMVVSMNRIADMSLEDNKHMKFNITVNLLKSPDVHAEFELLLETDLTDDTLSDFFKKVDKFVIAMRVVQDAPVDTEKKDILLKQSFELLKKLYQKYIDSSIFGLLLATDLTQDTRFSFAQKVDRLVIVTNVVRNAPIDQEKKDVFSKETLRLLKLLYEKYISSSVYDESDSNDIFVVELEDDIEELEEALSV